MSLKDKTLVVWAAPADLEQRGGSALTVDDGQGHFDGIVFGELEPRRWMPGSDSHCRTPKDQTGWAEETAGVNDLLQLALVCHGQEVTLYRETRVYGAHILSEPAQAYPSRLTVLFGRRHLDAGDADRSFAGRISDARIYDRPLDPEALAALTPGATAGDLQPWAWWSFGDQGLREMTGRFDAIQLVGDVRLEGGCLVLAGGGASVICRSTGSAVESAGGLPGSWPTADPVPDETVRAARLMREHLLSDPHRPGYHFCVPEDMGLPGDPNGAFYADGRYHLMYLYNRNGTGCCWGHISSVDLVHWRHHADAIGPGDGDEGCFSGGAFLDDDGTAVLSYWMLGDARGIGLALSTDADHLTWTKPRHNPVVESTEWGLTETRDRDGNAVVYGSADPSNIWKHDGRYYMLTGNLLVLNRLGREPDSPLSEQGDRLYLFESDDLAKWEYRHVFYERRPEWTEASEDNMCPSFLPLPSSPSGGPPGDKHLLLFISHNKGCQYYIGDYRDDRFFPDSHGRMTWVDNTYFAPEALIDGQGRQIMWSWLTDNPLDEKVRGWSGVYGLPRALWLGEDGALRLAPVPELESLRRAEQSWEAIALGDGESRILEGVRGDSCEIRLEIDASASGRCGLKVRASSDGREETLIYCDRGTRELVFDARRSGSMGRMVMERAPLALEPGEGLILRVFVDRSVVEVFANDRQAIGRRVYPEDTDSLGVALFSEGGEAHVSSVTAWEMAASNPF